MKYTRNFFLVFTTIILYNSSHSQKTFDPDKRPTEFRNIANLELNAASAPFNDVVVWDKRFDTSKIGYAKGKTFKKLKTTVPFDSAIAKTILKACYKKISSDTSQKLLLVIRHFWLSPNPEKSNKNIYSTVLVECYFQTGQDNFPLAKIDTTYTLSTASLPIEKIISYPFQLCLDKITQAATEANLAKKSKLNLTQITDHLQQNFVYPRFQNISNKRGVFLTYNDFLHNKLSFPNFRVEQGLQVDHLFVIENGGEKLFRDFWGYSDGKDFFIRRGFNFYKLVKQNNSYELFGLNMLQYAPAAVSAPHSGNSLLSLGSVYSINEQKQTRAYLVPMQLNMETGNPYGFDE